MEPTGYLNFSWANIQNVDGYLFKSYKNNSFFSTFDTFTNEYEVSGLIEGDSIKGTVYPYKNDNIYITGISIPEQYIPVVDFNAQGKTFKFSNFQVDQVPVNYVSTNSGYYASGQYREGVANLSFDIINPRDDSVLHSFNAEPFFSSLTNKILVDGIVVKEELAESPHIQILNSYESRNFTSQLTIQDFYGTEVTGNFVFSNESIKIEEVTISSSPTVDSFVDISIVPSYSSPATGIECLIYGNGGTSDVIVSGMFDSTNNFSINFPIDTTGFLSLTAYDWFGSGVTFEYADALYYSSAEYLDLQLNKIENPELHVDYNSGLLSYSSDIKNNSTSGSYFSFSIDSNQASSMNSYSYSTGLSNDLSSGKYFDFFGNRTGDHVDFFVNLNLYRSGSHILEDSVQLSGLIDYPKFTHYDYNFDYGQGVTEITINSVPDYSFDGVDLLVSGHEQTSYTSINSLPYSNNELISNIGFRLVDSNDHNIIFDSIEVFASGHSPEITIEAAQFNNPDGFQTILISNNSIPQEVFSFYEVYQKKTLKPIDGTISSTHSGILEFNDYQDHFLNNLYAQGMHQISAPSSVSRNHNYESTGLHLTGSSSPQLISLTGHYQSGTHYSYRVVPVNGYLSGNASSPIALEFPLNEITHAIDNSLNQAESNIVSLNEQTVNTHSSQSISGTKTFLSDIIITGSELNISTNEPSQLNHVATKNYVDSSLKSIRDTYSELNEDTSLITGNNLYLTNILFSGDITIDGALDQYSEASFYYPIECTGLKFEFEGQGSYYKL
jgi:hypothetical protein